MSDKCVKSYILSTGISKFAFVPEIVSSLITLSISIRVLQSGTILFCRKKLCSQNGRK